MEQHRGGGLEVDPGGTFPRDARGNARFPTLCARSAREVFVSPHFVTLSERNEPQGVPAKSATTSRLEDS